MWHSIDITTLDFNTYMYNREFIQYLFHSIVEIYVNILQRVCKLHPNKNFIDASEHGVTSFKLIKKHKLFEI
jgi:hypothetical protein